MGRGELHPKLLAINIRLLSQRPKKCWVKHGVLKGVTSPMLVWWFGHLAPGRRAGMPMVKAGRRTGGQLLSR